MGTDSADSGAACCDSADGDDREATQSGVLDSAGRYDADKS